MVNKVNYFKIGLFVIFAVMTLLGIVVLLGAGALTKEKVYFETYIDESVQGLTVGSPVKNRGVQVGRVEKIVFAANEYGLDPGSPEYIKYNRYVLVLVSADPEDFAVEDRYHFNELLDRMIADGFRIRLTQQALTGVAYLEANYFDPEEYPIPEVPWHPRYKYVPSIQSVLSTFTESAELALKKISNIDFEKLIMDFNDLVVNLDNNLTDMHLPEATADARVLMSELQDTNDSLKIFLKELRRSNHNLNEMLKPVENESQRISLPQLVANIDSAVTRLDQMIENKTPEIEATINSLKQTSDNFNTLSQDLKNNPSQIIFGNPPAKSEAMQ